MDVINASTDIITYFVLRDATNHAPKTDVDLANVALYYVAQGAAIVTAVTGVVALAAANSAHADNRGYHVGQGMYRIDWPDIWSGGVGKKVELIVACTGVDTTFLEVELTDPAQTGDSFARLGAPVGASISVDIAGCAVPGDEMDLVDAPNGTAVLVIQSGLAVPADITALLAEQIDGTLTLGQALAVIVARMAGPTSGGGTATLLFNDPTGTYTRITMPITSAFDDRGVPTFSFTGV
jgi:hypothetical protein